MFSLESPKLPGTSVPTLSKAIPDMTSPASGRHISKFEKRPKMPHSTALFEFSLMQCQRRPRISRVKNIGNVFELSGVAFRLPHLVCHSAKRHIFDWLFHRNRHNLVCVRLFANAKTTARQIPNGILFRVQPKCW